METTTVAPILQPNIDAMRRHLQHLFGGLDIAYDDARVELAWTDGRDGRLSHAEIFTVATLDKLLERAVAENSKQGQNVYIGQALRHPNTAPFGRGSDKDFYALTAFYVDIDDDVVREAAEKYRARGCAPTAVIFTGLTPHPRAQILWRLEAPVTDPNLCRAQNSALALALGGDVTVINPGRVMRLGGSIAWPRKKGRILELTEFYENKSGGPNSYSPGRIAEAFPLAQPELAPGRSGVATAPAQKTIAAAASSQDNVAATGHVAPVIAPAPVQAAVGSDLHIGTTGVSVDSCIAHIRAGDHWHDNMLRLVGHWVSRGWSDTEIAAAAEAMTLPGYTAAQTRREVAVMIAGGRAKWNAPNPVIAIDHASAPAQTMTPLTPTFLDSLNIAMLPRRRWLLGRALLRGHLTLLVAPAGVGKSTHGVARAVALATGRDITGEPVHEQVKAWVYNTEDDSDELKRRLGAVLQHNAIPFAEIRNRIALNSGADRPLLLARADKSGMVIRLPDVDACIAKIRENDIGVFIVDPFVETHEVNENSNEQIKVVAAMYREIARATQCAVLLVHHTAKPPQGASDGYAGNMNAARGASALVGVARVVQTLFGMSERDADWYGVAPKERHLYLRLDDAKANLGLVSPDALWFKKIGVDLANGDQVGVLEPVELAEVEASPEQDNDDQFNKTIIACLLARVAGDEITLNSATKLLAWCGDERFIRYRQVDSSGNQRGNSTLRRAITSACDEGVTVYAEGLERGFVLTKKNARAVLRRFSRAPPEALESPFSTSAEEQKR